LQLMADGNSNKQISQIVGITEATVKYHTSQLFKQLDVKNRTSCVREAQRRGLINKFDDLSGQ
jgi:DNA-binding NarL/FixJ family response regulator